ncbi:Ubiquitin carboxyl-terminal hydrolase [Aphelenchoides besseyi]|nr:Ubiquitin carboxyl-terminal hydrolase [Aphelenchoides besseyi]
MPCVTVKWSGQSLDVDADIQEEPLVFKSQLFAMTGVPPDRQKVMFKGKTLKDDTWEGFPVQEGSTLMMLGSTTMVPELKQETPKESTSNSVQYDENGEQMVIPELVEGISNWTSSGSSKTQNALMKNYTGSIFTLFRDLASKERECYIPLLQLTLMHKLYPQFATQGEQGGWQQQDANECFSELLREFADASEIEVKDEKNEVKKVPVRRFLEGEFEIQMKNTENPEETVQTSKEKFMQLSCFLSQDTRYLQSGIKSKLSEEIVKHSDTLGKDCTYLKEAKISRLPAHLTIQMVRFFYKEKDQEYEDNKIEEQRAAKLKEGKQIVKKEAEEFAPSSFKDDPGSCNSGFYQLNAIITHKGRSSNSGHYVAWIRLQGDKWAMCDDETTIPVTEEQVLKLSGGGGEVFKNVFDNAGPALPNALRPFICLEAGSCKLTSSFELKNFKKLAMCVLPELFDDEGLSRLDRVKVSMCIADALDLSVESSATSVVFTHWPIASVEQSAEILILCIAHWLRNSIYTEKLTSISLFLDMSEGFESYCHVAQLIEADPSLVLDVLQARRPDDYSIDPTVDADMVENIPVEYAESKTPLRMHWNSGRMMLDKRQTGTQNGSSPFLFYSRNLSTSILSIEQPDGTIHQYRLSTTVYEKNTHYFRCSRCDYLTRMHPEMGLFRPKITVRDGQIVSDRHPAHHPQCHGMSKENFVVQQLDRLWKAIAMYETDELRRCYVTLRNIASKEANSLYNEMENPEGQFPEWEVLRKTAEKYHDQYSMRLIKCANADGPSDMDGVNIDQYSEIRRVEGELDGVQNNGIAWLTEGVELERDEHEPEDTEAAPTSSGINTRSAQLENGLRNFIKEAAKDNQTNVQIKIIQLPTAIMVRINNASPAIQWSILRKHSAFLHKRRGIDKYFSSDPFNLTGKYTTRSSGIANTAGVSIRPTADKKGLIVETKKKSAGAARRPAKAINSTTLSGNPRAVIKSVGNLVKSYEPRLRASAQLRASQLLRSIHPRKRGGKNRKNKAAAASNN